MSKEDDIGDEEVSALYHQADGAVPPASLDADIMAAAKQAVEGSVASQRSSRSPFSGRWSIAASAAAVVVIAILLAPLLEQQPPQTENAPPSASMDDLRNSAEPAQAKKATRERMPASSPGRLYAPEPARMMEQQQPSVMAESINNEDRALGPDYAGMTTPSHAITTENRVQARLNAAGGSPLAVFTPEMWLVKIQQLIDSGRIAEAADELDRFMQAHPDYEIDQKLLERLKQP
jgi:hypothetical protein